MGITFNQNDDSSWDEYLSFHEMAKRLHLSDYPEWPGSQIHRHIQMNGRFHFPLSSVSMVLRATLCQESQCFQVPLPFLGRLKPTYNLGNLYLIMGKKMSRKNWGSRGQSCSEADWLFTSGQRNWRNGVNASSSWQPQFQGSTNKEVVLYYEKSNRGRGSGAKGVAQLFSMW